MKTRQAPLPRKRASRRESRSRIGADAADFISISGHRDIPRITARILITLRIIPTAHITGHGHVTGATEAIAGREAAATGAVSAVATGAMATTIFTAA